MGRGSGKAVAFEEIVRAAPSELLGESWLEAEQRLRHYLKPLFDYKQPFSQNQQFQMLESSQLRELATLQQCDELRTSVVKWLALRIWRGGEQEPLRRLLHRIWLVSGLTTVTSQRMLVYERNKHGNIGMHLLDAERKLLCGRERPAEAALGQRGAKSLLSGGTECCSQCFEIAERSGGFDDIVRREIAESNGYLPVGKKEASALWEKACNEAEAPLFELIKERQGGETVYRSFEETICKTVSAEAAKQLLHRHRTTDNIIKQLCRELPRMPVQVDRLCDSERRELLLEMALEAVKEYPGSEAVTSEQLAWQLQTSCDNGRMKDLAHARIDLLISLIAETNRNAADYLQRRLLGSGVSGRDHWLQLLGG